jgi:hypothetical protein
MASGDIEANMTALLDALDGLDGDLPATWESMEALPVQFPAPTCVKVTRGHTEAASIDDLMQGYLTALKEVRRIDGDLPSSTRQPPEADSTTSSAALEAKLTTLMRALSQNNSDTWADKPTQIPLSELIESQRAAFQQLLDCGDEDIEISAFSGASSSTAPTAVTSDETPLDALVLQYAKELKVAPLPVATTTSMSGASIGGIMITRCNGR